MKPVVRWQWDSITKRWACGFPGMSRCWWRVRTVEDEAELLEYLNRRVLLIF